MRMLNDLKDMLDDIEQEDDWAARFVTDLLERTESNDEYRLTGPQFAKLNEIHQRFVKRWLR